MTFQPLDLQLVCHPAGTDPRVRDLRVAVTRDGRGGLMLQYRLRGDLAGLRIPRAGSTLPPERLWAHTCFELFVAGAGAAGYREFNFSPNGQWMQFDFAGYRQPIPSVPASAPVLAVTEADDALELVVHLGAELLPGGNLRVGLSAVVERRDGGHTYWALRHPADQPDFHHREGFALALKDLMP